MGGKSTETKYSNKYDYDYKTPPVTAQTQAFLDYNPDTSLLDENLSAQYGAARRGITEGYNAPGSGITSSVLRNRLRDEALQQLQAQQDTALRGGAQDVNRLMLQKKLLGAQLTNPQLVQTGGSGVQNTKQKGSFWGGLLSGFGAVGKGFGSLVGGGEEA